MHKVGDTVWRGYARHFGDPKEVWPEIRPGKVTAVDEDGTIAVALKGIMPGTEGKRNPGGWMAWYQPPERYRATPEEALADAKAAVTQHENAPKAA